MSFQTRPSTHLCSHLFHSFILATFVSLIALSGCGGVDGSATDDFPDDPIGAGGAGGAPVEGRVLLRANPDARERAEQIREAVPGSRLRFSQRTGHLMMVQGPMAPADDENPSTSKPLGVTRGKSREAMLSTLLDYFARFEDAYGIEAPLETLRVSEESEAAQSAPDVNDSFTHVPQSKKQISVRLGHTHQGLLVEGRYATGLFDDDGNLRAVLTRLIPLPENLDPTPTLSEDEAVAAVAAELPRLIRLDPELRWAHDAFERAEHLKLLFWHPATRSGESMRLAYKVEARAGHERARFIVDAHTGEVLFGASMLPSEWHEDGAFEVTPAPDTLGNVVQIPSTVHQRARYMGYGANQVGARFFRAGQSLIIGDVSNTVDRGSEGMSLDPIQITIDGGNDWLSDPGYNTAHQFAATQLMDVLTKTMQWWLDRGWRSWDGRGSSFVANVGVNKREDTTIPQRNAWGGSGTIQIGDGLTASGFYYGASAEVVGHEFMHNVISSTSEFAYHDEPGALNEALADIFGVALTAIGDRLSSPWIADDVGERLRNLQDPTLRGDPDRYSSYLETERDNGGVHSNSGIFNKAHYLVVQGGTFNGASVEAQGVEATTSVLRGANELLAWDTETSMEEFAAGVVAYCDMIAGIGEAIGDEGLDETCDAFDLAYWAVELIPGSRDTDLGIESVQIGARGDIEVVVRNFTHRSVTPSEHFELVIRGLLGIRTTASPSSSFDAPLAAGSSVAIRTSLPADFMNPLTRTNTTSIEAELAPIRGNENLDSDMSNNTARMELGPDLMPKQLSLTEVPGGFEYAGRVTNNGRTGYTEGVDAVVLVRYTAHGPLVPTFGGDVSLAEDGGSLDRTEDCLPSGIRFPAWQFVAGPLSTELRPIVIPGTSPVGGLGAVLNLLQAWFDRDGGLAELEGEMQLYLLVDPYDEIEETDETNNLLCANCRAQGGTSNGVIVRLSSEVDTDALFPEPYRAAAAKLKSHRPLMMLPARFSEPRFGPYIGPEPVFELP